MQGQFASPRYALAIRNGIGQPIELHRLDPDAVTQEATPDGEPVYRIRQAKGGDRLHPWQSVPQIRMARLDRGRMQE